MKESLISIVKQWNKITEMVAENGGELSEEMDNELTKVELLLPAKVDACSHVMDRIDKEIELLDAQAEFYSKISKTYKNIKARIKDNIKFGMQELQVEELCGNDIRFVLTKTKSSLKIDEDLIDPGYVTEEVTKIIDKRTILMDLRNGLPVAGAQLVETVALRSYPNRRK